MMFETLGSLPLHPLIVHAVVVIGPLSALGALGYVLVARWRPWLRWLVALGALATAGAAQIARVSGEYLADAVTGGHLPQTGPLADHMLLGHRLAWVAVGWAALAVVITLLVPAVTAAHRDEAGARPPRRPAGAASVVLDLLLLAGAVALVYMVVRTGDAGSHAVWDGTPLP